MMPSQRPTGVISCPWGRPHGTWGTTGELTLTIPGNKCTDTIYSVLPSIIADRGWWPMKKQFGRGSCVLDALAWPALGRRKEVGVGVCWWGDAVVLNSQAFCNPWLSHSSVLEFCSWQRWWRSNFYTSLLFQSGGWGKLATWQKKKKNFVLFIFEFSFSFYFGPLSIFRYLHKYLRCSLNLLIFQGLFHKSDCILLSCFQFEGKGFDIHKQ